MLSKGKASSRSHRFFLSRSPLGIYKKASELKSQQFGVGVLGKSPVILAERTIVTRLMRYYIRKDAASEIEGPFELEALRGWVAGGRFTNDFEAIEDTGRSTDDIRASRRWQLLEDVFTDPLSKRIEQSPGAFLAGVRQNSCYKALRLFIDLTSGAAWLTIAGLTYLEVGKSSPGDSTVQLVVVLGIFLMASIALIAARQFATLFADIADILIHQNRKK